MSNKKYMLFPSGKKNIFNKGAHKRFCGKICFSQKNRFLDEVFLGLTFSWSTKVFFRIVARIEL
jgi:hypothetical protein